MNRRDALRALLATLAASPGVLPNPARAQPRVLRAVSVTGNSEQSIAPTLATFREELKALGYVEGRNLSFDFSAGEFSRERTRQLAAEAMAKKPDIIFAQHLAVHAFSDLTRTIPIIAVYSGDMVEAGLVKSLARPGVNITGVQLLGFDLVGKRIEILKELVPSIKRLAVFAMSAHPGVTQEREVSVAAAKQLGISIAFYPLSTPQELDAGLVAAQAQGVNGGWCCFRTRSRCRALRASRLSRCSTNCRWCPPGTTMPTPADSSAMALTCARRGAALPPTSTASRKAPTRRCCPSSCRRSSNWSSTSGPRALGVKIPQSVFLRADRVIE